MEAGGARWRPQRAHAGDAVLMSPACASFDMFSNYAHRAEVFRAAVQALADEAGVRAARDSAVTPAAAVRGWFSRLAPMRCRLPVRRQRACAAGRAVRVHGFDQALLWVTVALLAFGLVMVYSASIALPDNPQVRALRAHLLPARAMRCSWRWRFVAGAAGVPGADGDLGDAARPGCSSLSLLLLVLVLVPHIGKGVNGARRWICAGLHELPAVRAGQVRGAALRRRLHGAQDGREGALLPRRAADGAWRWRWSACCCWPSPTWAPSW